MVDRVGFTFFFRQMESTGAVASDIIRAYTISLHILDIESLWQTIELNQSKMPAPTQLELLHILMRLVRRTTRWLLRNRRLNLNCADLIDTMSAPIKTILGQLPDLHEQEWIKLWTDEKEKLMEWDVDEAMAGTLAAADSMFLSVGTAEMALRLNRPVALVAELGFKLGEMLSLDWFMSQIVELKPANRWQDLARESYVDDLESQRRQLTACLLKGHDQDDIAALIDQWQIQQAPLINRWKSMVKELRRGSTPDFAMVSVALRELLDLVQASVDSV
jgi:glutamate dehydrogenase